jgi:hypothetical protein
MQITIFLVLYREIPKYLSPFMPKYFLALYFRTLVIYVCHLEVFLLYLNIQNC